MFDGIVTLCWNKHDSFPKHYVKNILGVDVCKIFTSCLVRLLRVSQVTSITSGVDFEENDPQLSWK